MKKLKVALAGLGSRGKDTYAKCADIYPDKMEIVAIADIDIAKVNEVSSLYNIPRNMCFNSAEELLEQERVADVMFITTQDKQHVGHAIPALKKGYHILLEKPISPDLDECREIVKVAKEYNRKVVVCHVLRYTPFFTKLKQMIEEDSIGDVVNVMALENVGYWHQAHSFVRGNWRNSETTSPMILAKCCHDMDLYLWLTGKTCKSVSSFGSTYLFKEECAPEGAALRCLDGCKAKENCPFDAEKIYITNKKIGVANGYKSWPLDVVALHPSVDSITEAIKTGPYGRCVYYCDNNVVDHQVVNLEMTDGSNVHLTMSGFTATGSRYAKFMGTKGEIIADMSTNIIKLTRFGEDTVEIDVSKIANDFSGHGGGDNRMVSEFLDLLIYDKEPTSAITSVEHSVESHYCALAAEESRLSGGQLIELDTFRK
jgi:predicted dehydrogenase